MKKIALALTLTFALSLMAQNSQSLPDLVLKDMNGKPKNVSDYSKSGKITIISFWATWCSPCIKELRNIQPLYEDWQKEYGLQLVAVTVDNAKNTQKVKPFVNGQGWDYEVLLDTNEDLKRALNAPNVPFTVLLDKTGKIVFTHNGYVEGDEFELEKKIKEIAGK
ncbi:MAG: TlpA family protein disulfide reductase [Bacteroidia bacterium]|nr:TlpA family protein disulfide reductase [Bacteroidia bacterium]